MGCGSARLARLAWLAGRSVRCRRAAARATARRALPPPPVFAGGSAVRPVYYAWNDKLKIARLPLRYFANGHTYFVQRLYQKKAHPPPFVVHMTYQYGDASEFPYGKRQRMREGRVWQVRLQQTPTAMMRATPAPDACPH